ncbi:hypothetical protein [Sphingomonas melonis]|uniref:hypothetical protein n=1 Tax=Sphingomonas TaxID=13687 RepID=UPI0036C0E5BB
MILVRFARTFRERAPEWVLAFIQTGWGATLLLPGETFNRPFFRPLAAIAPEMTWGTVVAVAGMIRLAALYINGSRQETPVVRQACSLVSMLIWAMLTMGAMTAEWRSPAVFNYLGLFALEAIMFSYAGRDAARNLAKAAANGTR